MSDTIWLRKGGGYSLSISPSMEYDPNVALVIMHTPGGYLSLSVDREWLVSFVDELSSALQLTEPSTNSVQIAHGLVPSPAAKEAG